MLTFCRDGHHFGIVSYRVEIKDSNGVILYENFYFSNRKADKEYKYVLNNPYPLKFSKACSWSLTAVNIWLW